nr:uncharacterized protein LOC129268772 [Lytechinus pictus]
MGRHNNNSTYYIDDQILEETKAERDLGVLVDNELNYHAHVAQAVNRANQMLGLIKRIFTYLSRETLPVLFKTLVRPLLEYCNVIWYPRFKLDAIKIEKIQRRATKLVPELKHLTYETRLKELNMFSLHYRRIRGDYD